MAGIPPHIREIAELSPAEDLLLYVLRQGLPGIRVQSMINLRQVFPLILIRRQPHFGNWSGDDRFTDVADIALNVFCEDPDGDADAALLSDAARIVLRNSWLPHSFVVPGRGHITRADMTSAPRRAPDWSTATGPVQYADLPTGVHRYESLFRVSIKKARNPIL